MQLSSWLKPKKAEEEKSPMASIESLKMKKL